MVKKRILIVTHEIKPYLLLTEMAAIAHELVHKTAPSGFEIRVMMPRFAEINERRNRLHEVVRLSGINIQIHKDDNPLVIKVASLQPSRIQCYFMENEDFFKRPNAFIDGKTKKFYEDNDERMIFYNRAVLETVRKFGWAPDIIHTFGWFSALIPAYIKTVYKNDPVLGNSKVVQSIYNNVFKDKLDPKFTEKAIVNNLIKAADLKDFKDGDNTSMYLGAIKHADALIQGNDFLDEKVMKAFQASKKPKLTTTLEENVYEKYFEFYKTLLA